jgi:hypothetical protein
MIAARLLLVLTTRQFATRRGLAVVPRWAGDPLEPRDEAGRLSSSCRQTYPPPLGPPTSAMYSARLSLGCGYSPLERNRRRRVSFVIQVRAREAARVPGGNRPSKEQTGQIAQNSDSVEFESIGTLG